MINQNTIVNKVSLRYHAWENIGGLKHWQMVNLNQFANKKLANGLTWLQWHVKYWRTSKTTVCLNG